MQTRAGKGWFAGGPLLGMAMNQTCISDQCSYLVCGLFRQPKRPAHESSDDVPTSTGESKKRTLCVFVSKGRTPPQLGWFRFAFPFLRCQLQKHDTPQAPNLHRISSHAPPPCPLPLSGSGQAGVPRPDSWMPFCCSRRNSSWSRCAWVARGSKTSPKSGRWCR